MSLFQGTKIQRILLKNFIGIHTGMGLFELEIDFSVSEHRNILLLGSNGSGKSTIMSTLHAFRETFDERTNLILDGKVGRKEIDIQQDGALYKIIHHYDGTKSKSTISKHVDGEDPIELNPAGTLRSFNIIVEEELGLTPSFFSLIKIGSQSDNFIDLKSSQRKEFIGNFTPNIDEYLEAYKVVQSKYSISNKEIRFIVSELDKLKSIEVTNKSIKVLKISEKSLQSQISELLSQQKYNEHILKDTSVLDKIASLQLEVKEKRDNVLITERELESIEESTNRSFRDHEKLLRQIKKRETTKTTKNEELTELKILRAELGQVVKSNELQINKIDSDIKRLSKPDITVTNLKTNLEEETANFNLLLEKIDYDISLDSSFESFIEEYQAYEKFELLSKVISFLNFAQNDILAERNIDLSIEFKEEQLPLTISNFQKFLTSKETQLTSTIAKLTTDINDFEEEILQTEKDIAAAEAVNDYLPLCSNSSDCCLFDKLNNTIHDTTTLDKDITTTLVNTKNELSIVIGERSDIREMVTFIEKLIERLSGIERAVSDYLIDIYEDSDFTTLEEILVFGSVASLDKQLGKANKTLREIKIVNKLNSTYQLITKIESQISNFSESESTLKHLMVNRKELVSSVIPTKQKYEDVKERVEALIAEIEKDNRVLTVYYNVLEVLTTFVTLSDELELDTLKLTELNTQNKGLLDAKDNLVKISTEIEALEEELDGVQEELSNERLEAVRIKEYTSRKEELESNRKILSILKDALDVKSGIPLVLVGDYLDSIRNSCNKLLAIAYKGKFFIDFEISDKDFFISVFKNGTKTASDIRQCSQGEISLVKTSLSLGIIAQAISSLKKQYNIVYLDEIDAELDSKNRMVFLDILEQQLDTLNSSQCFIITHNNSFFSSNAGLVLLNGHKIDTDDEEFMENKTLIFEA